MNEIEKLIVVFVIVAILLLFAWAVEEIRARGLAAELMVGFRAIATRTAEAAKAVWRDRVLRIFWVYFALVALGWLIFRH